MKVNEIFESISGEGISMGMPSTFVRFSGCNLNCKWCDSTYSNESFEEMTVIEILD